MPRFAVNMLRRASRRNGCGIWFTQGGGAIWPRGTADANRRADRASARKEQETTPPSVQRPKFCMRRSKDWRLMPSRRAAAALLLAEQTRAAVVNRACDQPFAAARRSRNQNARIKRCNSGHRAAHFFRPRGHAANSRVAEFAADNRRRIEHRESNSAGRAYRTSRPRGHRRVVAQTTKIVTV